MVNSANDTWFLIVSLSEKSKEEVFNLFVN